VSEELFVPGRVCLFGEHSDWAAEYAGRAAEIAYGLCLVAGTDQGLRAEWESCPESLVVESVLSDGQRLGPESIPLEPEALAAVARTGGFFSYAAGTAAALLARYPVEGLRLRIAADLPVGKGLSSSAAVCVLVARAFGRHFDLGLSVRDEMQLAYAGERLAGSECGRMDQICAYGRRVSLLRVEGEELEVETLTPGGRLDLVIVDLGRGKDTRRILADLNACFPDAPGSVAAGVRRALGERNLELVGRARDALVAGDAECLGALMTEAQARFDADVAPASPGELSAPRLHEVLDHPGLGELAFGGKGVGSGGDGCAQLVARGPEEREALEAFLERELGLASLPLALGVSEAQEAAPAQLPTRLA